MTKLIGKFDSGGTSPIIPEELRLQVLQNSEYDNWRDAYTEYSGEGGGSWKERRNFKRDWKDKENVRARIGEKTYDQLRATAEQQQFGNIGYNPDNNAKTLTREEKRFNRRFNRKVRNGSLKPHVTNNSESTFTKNDTVLYPLLQNYRFPGSVQNTYEKAINWSKQYYPNLTGVKEGIEGDLINEKKVIDYNAEGLRLLGQDYMTPDKLTKIQQFLISKNYDLGNYGADGKYGQETNDALVEYLNEVGTALGLKNINALFDKPVTPKAQAAYQQGIGLNSNFGSSGTYFNVKNPNYLMKYSTYGNLGYTPASTTTLTANTQNQFDFDNFTKENNQYTVKKINGKEYLRYNPSGVGDFYVGQDGQIYSSGMFGELGQVLTKTGNKLIFSDGNTFASQGKHLDKFNELLRIMSPYVTKNKQGGKMNRINYFQQGGQMQQDQEEELKLALTGYVVATKKQPKSEKEVQQLIQEITMLKQKDPETYNQLVQLGSQAQQQQQATMAKWGSKLGYIKSLKYAKGGKTCFSCQNGGKPLETPSVNKSTKKVEEKACGGKTKKRYFGGII